MDQARIQFLLEKYLAHHLAETERDELLHLLSQPQNKGMLDIITERINREVNVPTIPNTTLLRNWAAVAAVLLTILTGVYKKTNFNVSAYPNKNSVKTRLNGAMKLSSGADQKNMVMLNPEQQGKLPKQGSNQIINVVNGFLW